MWRGSAGGFRPQLVLPVHYETFERIETDAGGFEREVETSNRTVRLF
jgi:L-ascorbate metabolism protein UlaG (beta-lactamase superfamily)